MASQLMLFEAEKRTREFWELSKPSVGDAAAILIELLRECGPMITFREVVKRKLGISGDSIPEMMARQFADQVDAVTEERLRIKEYVEELGEFQLTVVDGIGRPAIRGGTPDGFSLRQSEAGENDQRARLEMATGQFKAIFNQQRALGRISDVEFDQLVGTVQLVQQRLLVPHSA